MLNTKSITISHAYEKNIFLVCALSCLLFFFFRRLPLVKLSFMFMLHSKLVDIKTCYLSYINQIRCFMVLLCYWNIHTLSAKISSVYQRLELCVLISSFQLIACFVLIKKFLALLSLFSRII